MNQKYLKLIDKVCTFSDNVNVCEPICAKNLKIALEKSFSENLGFGFSDCFGKFAYDFLFNFADTYRVLYDDKEYFLPIYNKSEVIFCERFNQGFSEALLYEQLGYENQLQDSFQEVIDYYDCNDIDFVRFKLAGLMSVKQFLDSNQKLNLETLTQVFSNFNYDDYKKNDFGHFVNLKDEFSVLAKIIFYDRFEENEIDNIFRKNNSYSHLKLVSDNSKN